MSKPGSFARFAASATPSAPESGPPGPHPTASPSPSRLNRPRWLDPRDPFTATRWRLLAWVVGVLAVILCVVGVLVYLSVARTRAEETDQRLRTVAVEQERRLAFHDRDELGGFFPDAPDVFLYVRDRSGQALVTPRISLPGFPDQAALRTALAGRSSFARLSTAAGVFRVYSTPLIRDGRVVGVVQAGTSLVAQQRELRELLLILLLGGLAGLVLAAGGGFFLVELALAPARQAFARQQQFAADASHELRTPVALIRATAEVLAREQNRSETAGAELLADIVRETDHLGRLIDDLLQLARLDSGQLRAELAPVPLSEVVQEAAEEVRRLDLARDLRLVVAAEPNLWANGDLGRLRQVLLILLDNAVKHTPAGGTIRLALQREHGWARLAVIDTGEGIPPEHLPRLFDRFYRVDQARSRAERGVGLGLAIARELISLQGGRIKADSQPGRGSTFTVWLPLARMK